MNNDIEQKRKKIQLVVEIVAFIGACIILGPLYLTIIHGIGALCALAVGIGLAAITTNVIAPWLSISIANWRLKAIKAAAAANPIEMLETQYGQKQDALLQTRDNIKKSYAVLQTLYSQIQEHDEKYPGKPSQYLEKYQKLKALVELQGKKYKQAQVNLANFAEVIEEKRSDWNIAKTMAEASKLANVGEDFQSKLLQDTALITIQDGLNTAFAELDASLLDAQALPSDSATVSAPPATPAAITSGRPVAQIPEKIGPPALDLGFDENNVIEAEAVPVKSARNRRSY
jgi:hypothetical protein